MMTWEVLDFVFIFHWNENETSPVFSQSRVVLIQEHFFPPSNSDHFFSLVFSPEMTRKATLSIRNQKTAQVIKPLSDTVFTHTYVQRLMTNSTTKQQQHSPAEVTLSGCCEDSCSKATDAGHFLEKGLRLCTQWEPFPGL